jgi:antitoxin CcdA
MSLAKREKSGPARKATNLSLDTGLLAEAIECRVNLSKAAERGLRETIAEARAEAWLIENQAALESSNRYVEEHGLPLARHRQF